MPVMGVPEQVQDAEYEQRLERVAAIDVAKASGKVCTRVPHESKAGKRVTLVWDVPATTNAICELAQQLVAQGIERVVVESTSDYWRPFFYLLEAAGLTVWHPPRPREGHLRHQPHQPGQHLAPTRPASTSSRSPTGRSTPPT